MVPMLMTKGWRRVRLAAFDHLQRHDRLGGHGDGIHAFVRRGTVGHLAVDDDVKAVAVRVVDARRVADLPGLQIMHAVIRGASRLHHLCRGVQAKNRRRLGIFHHTFRHHQLRAPIAFERGRHRLLGRLKQKLHAALHLIAVLREQLCHTQRAGHMHIMSAGMHHAGFCER
jgi:hypothetical protein